MAGRVADAAGNTVASGTVYLVPATEVAALAAMPIDLQLSPTDTAALAIDEPIEDLLDVNAATYESAAVDDEGVYRFTTVTAGEYFVVWTPEAADDAHLPGGSHVRTALASSSFVGTQLDLEVSGRPSETAHFVGSSACMVCHGRHESERTAHFNGLHVPGRRGDLQDTSAWEDFDAGLAEFRAGTVLYYYACDAAASGFSKCRIATSAPPPPAVVSFELRLGYDATAGRGEPGEYYVDMVNRLGAGSRRQDVLLTYGGAVNKQRYVTRVTNPDGSVSSYMLPLQYNQEGDFTMTSSNNWPWRDYNSQYWYDFATSTLRTPGLTTSFDNNCAGCHFTGFELEGSATTGWRASAVSDPNGEIDFDGDGRLEEINTGCESCHGPGSDHLENVETRDRIVSPSLLTPEREAQICGSCHSRPAGIGGGANDTPLSAELRMPRVGIRRAEFAMLHTSRVDGRPSDFWASGDSRSHHQQYSDFIRSSMYRNDSVLMTCSNCHDPHGNDYNTHQLRVAAEDNRACTSCHSGAVYTTAFRDHLLAGTGNRHDVVAETDFTCITCHMVNTVSSGAQTRGLLDNLPGSATPVQYLLGDLASHRFDVPLRDAATGPNAQPTAVTQSCGLCHGSFFLNP